MRQFENEYRQTDFCVDDGDVQIVIRIGEPNAALEHLLFERKTIDWAFTTAFNPGSVFVADDENRFHQAELIAQIERKSFPYLNGCGRGYEGDWPPEPSVLVLGIGRDDAKALGSQFRQLAIVVGQYGGTSELLWCD